MNFAGRTILGACSVAAIAALLTPQLSLAADMKLGLKDEPRPAVITLQETEEGGVFADKNGMTLYTDRDETKPNTPACTYDVPILGEVAEADDIRAFPPYPNPTTCLHKHKPVVDIGDGKAVGPWAVIEDSYGIKQWAYKGHVVYTSVKDLAVGQNWLDIETGLRQGRKRFLTLFAPLELPPDITVQEVGVAKVFATYSGRTLYTLTQDRVGKSMCDGACLDQWKPFLGGALSQPRGEWTLVTRDDHTRQWAFRGKPLYQFASDKAAGDTRGNNLPGALVAVAYPAAREPSSVTIQGTPVGDLYADDKGMTLYAYICPGSGGRECDDPTEKMNWWYVICGNTPEKCAKEWKPFLASENAKPTGGTWTTVSMPLPWSPVMAAPGSKEPSVKVWAYKGRPLFTHANEDRPGMIDGMDIGTLGGPKWFSIRATGADLNRKTTAIQAAR